MYTPVTENTGRLDFVGQPLDHETLEPVGTDSFVASDVMVNSDATYDVPLVGTLPARANPLSTPVLTNADIHGSIVSADFLCGTVTGTAGNLNLEGSEWSATRITGATLPPQVLRCADGPTR